MSITTVLVTGATGHVGSHVVDQLLASGYKVKAAARSGTAPRLVENYKSFGDRFSITIIDDISTSDFVEALQGVQAVIHVASPLSGAAEAGVVLKGAIEGTTRILEAAAKVGVHKIVITSSIVGIADIATISKDGVISVDNVNPVTWEQATKPGLTPFEVYAASKGLADKATWDLAKKHPELDIAAIYPPYIFGPAGSGQVLDTPVTGNNRRLLPLVQGEPGRPLPETSIIASYIDVRDLARAHVAALALPKSSTPKRFITNGGEFTWAQAVRHLRQARPEFAGALPELGLQEDEEQPVPPHAKWDSSSAAEIVGSYISFERSLEDTIDDGLQRQKELAAREAA
ncbi:NAD-P-binding protein [Gloeopeniophorella convolvens]|nr:NAD-P-binding protein [Gloeopeniophorella convolvens]